MTNVFQTIIEAVSGVFGSIFSGLNSVVGNAGEFLGNLS